MENTISALNHILKEISFFEEFTEEELDFFARNISLRSFPEKTVLFEQGDIGEFLFFVVDGEIEVRLEATGPGHIIGTFGRGACLGEMSIVDDAPRSATVTVAKPSDLLVLTRDRFQSICEANPMVGLKFMSGIAKNLSIRLRKTTGRFADIA